MKRRIREHGGFTLPEVLVTVALISILAAVVVPTIASQVKKGDPNRVGSDMIGMRGAIEQFLSDVRKYPRSIGQLTNTIANTGTNMTPLTSTITYGTADVNRWKGPYLTKDSSTAIATGFNASIKYLFDTCTLATTGTSSTVGGIKFLIISIPGLDSLSWLAVDQAIDDGVINTGSIRWVGTGTSNDTLKFLAMPIQP